MAIRKIVSRSILDGAIAPVDTTGVATPTTLTVSGISTFPELDNIQVTAPNRHSVDPTLILDFANSKTLDPRITFTRGSSATYYDGTTAKAEQNLLLNSETFSSWGKANLSATNNATTAPNGTATATLLTQNNASAEHYISCVTPLVNNVVYTYSVYAKPNGSNWLVLNHNNATGATFVYFNISTGTVGTTGSGITASMVNAGNGWYRCILTIRHITASHGDNGVQLYIANSSGSTTNFAGDGTSGVYIWGAQLEERSSVTAYTATTTTAITNYIPVLKTAGPNQARFDVDPITLESKGLLLEEQRTNIVTDSDVFTSGWTNQNMTVTGETAVAPDGTLTADKAILTAVNNYHSLYRAITYVTGNTYTYSLYVKAGELTQLVLSIDTGFNSSGANAVFNLATGVVTSSSAITTARITAVGNGWYRCAISAPCTGSGATLTYIVPTNSGGAAELGNAWNGLYIWGIQIEIGSFATSYIPTAASSVTRNFDYPVISGSNFSSWFNNTAGTVYVEAKAALNAASGGAPFVYLVDSAQGSQNDLYIDNDSGNARLYAWDKGSAVVSMNLSTVTAGTSYKIAGAYKLNDYAASKNGDAVVTDTSATVPANLSQMIIGRDIFNALSLNSTIKKIAYYPIRLTNAELIGMTTA